MVVSLNDGLDRQIRPGSTQSIRSEFTPIQKGRVTRVEAGTSSAWVICPDINEGAELGPFPCMRPLAKSTLDITTGTVDSSTVVTNAVLNNSSPATGDSSLFELPVVGTNVVIVFSNNSLDEGIVIGRLPW